MPIKISRFYLVISQLYRVTLSVASVSEILRLFALSNVYHKYKKHLTNGNNKTYS